MSGQNIELVKNLLNFPIALDPFPMVLCDKNINTGQCDSTNGTDIKLDKSSISGQDTEVIPHGAAVASMMTKSSNEDRLGKFIFKTSP